MCVFVCAWRSHSASLVESPKYRAPLLHPSLHFLSHSLYLYIYALDSLSFNVWPCKCNFKFAMERCIAPNETAALTKIRRLAIWLARHHHHRYWRRGRRVVREMARGIDKELCVWFASLKCVWGALDNQPTLQLSECIIRHKLKLKQIPIGGQLQPNACQQQKQILLNLFTHFSETAYERESIKRGPLTDFRFI